MSLGLHLWPSSADGDNGTATGVGQLPFLQPVASLFDPGRLIDLAEQAVKTSIRVASLSERQIFGAIRSGMGVTNPPAPTQVPPPPPIETTETLDGKMRRLLDRAIEQSGTASRQELFDKLLDQLVPDEARIISALSDGSASPLLHVYARTRAGLPGDVALENMSLIGKTANLTLPHLTPIYVRHLLWLGLVESGAEDTSLKEEYEILAADTTVLGVIKKVSRGPIPARIEKCTLRLSGLGLELWAATSGARGEE